MASRGAVRGEDSAPFEMNRIQALKKILKTSKQTYPTRSAARWEQRRERR